MSETTVGRKLDPKNLPLRDAIHVAILPMIAGQNLYRGDKIRLKLGTTNVALRADYHDPKARKAPRESEAIGVVDPFLDGWEGIEEGQAFYAFITPGTICGMRHHWEHPSLIDDPARNEKIEILSRAEPESKEESEKWLMDFADRYGFNFDDMIETCRNPSERDQWGASSYLVAMGRDLHGEEDLDPGDLTLFWSHLENYLGKRFDSSHRDKVGWSCSC